MSVCLTGRTLSGMSMPVQLQNASYQLFFFLTDIQGEHACQLRISVASGQHDGLRAPLQEKGRMLKIDLRRKKIVYIHVGSIVRKGFKRREGTDDGCRNKLFQQDTQA